MDYNAYRRFSLSRSAKEVEEEIRTLDEYLYVDGDREKPGAWQVWRKHPSGRFPMHILDIPPQACGSAVRRMLQKMDMGGRDIVQEAHETAIRKQLAWEKTRRYNNGERAKDVAKFINKHY